MEKRGYETRYCEKYWIITVVDSISETSMPINEFVLYRAKNGYVCRQTVLVYNKQISGNNYIPKNVETLFIDKNTQKIRQFIRRAETVARNEGINIVYHLHHPKSALSFYRASIGTGIRRRILFTVHSTYRDRNIKYKFSSALCVLMAQRANCVSISAFMEYSPLVRKIKGETLTAILNGVDFTRVEENKDKNDNRGIYQKRKRLICVGRMISLKNHVFLVELLKYLPNCEMVLIGEEDREGNIRRLVNKNKLNDRVIFTGLLERQEVFRWLFKCGIYVSASLVEGMPISVLEAMSAGLIPVLSDIGPHREIKQRCSEVNVLPLEIQAWITQINKLIFMREAEFNESSEKCKNSAKGEYSLETMHKRYFDLYAAMCSKCQ